MAVMLCARWGARRGNPSEKTAAQRIGASYVMWRIANAGEGAAPSGVEGLPEQEGAGSAGVW